MPSGRPSQSRRCGRLTSRGRREQQERRGMGLRLRASRHPRALSSGVAGSQPSVLSSARSGRATAPASTKLVNDYFGYSLARGSPAPQGTAHKTSTVACSCWRPLRNALCSCCSPHYEESTSRVDIACIIRSCLYPLLPTPPHAVVDRRHISRCTPHSGTRPLLA
ncbi:hypothetical protein M3J09_012017 [Ascochyta lentis]